MPKITLNGVGIYYEDSAPNDHSKPVIVFAHGLLWSTRLYDKQVAYLKGKYRCIAYDFRGQGKSEVTKSGYDMDTLTDDTVALIKHLDISPCHFVGLSMGGFIGMRIAIRHPELLKSLVLLETSADPEPKENIPSYTKLIEAIRWLGIKAVSKKVMPIMFGESFLKDKSRKKEYKQYKKRMEANNKKGAIASAKGVIYRDGVYGQLGEITTPTLIGVGNEDVATVYAKSERMHLAIAGSKLVVFEGAGHTSSMETPDRVNQVIENFIENIV